GAITINNGILRPTSLTALGSTSAGTTVTGTGTLQLESVISFILTGEALNLNGSGFGGNGALRSLTGPNTYNAPITLGSSAEIQTDAGTLTLPGLIGGTGTL